VIGTSLMKNTKEKDLGSGWKGVRAELITFISTKEVPATSLEMRNTKYES
jgi:hypothetical protein